MKWMYLLIGVVALMVSGCERLSERLIGPDHASSPGVQPTNAINPTTFSWPGGDWSAHVAYEARHAMSDRNDGTSNWPVPMDAYGPRWLADRCYTAAWNGEANDPYALDRAITEAGGYVGTIGHEPGGSHHFGGWCTFFLRDVLFRSSYGARLGCHLTTPNFGRGSMWAWCDSRYMISDFASAKPGWIGLKPPPHEHALVLDQRATVNGRDGWWVIDSNFLGTWLIGRHFMPMSVLNGSYWAWAPTLATSD